MRRRMHGYTGPALPGRFQETSRPTLRVTLSRLKKKGFVESKSGSWAITKRGRDFLVKALRMRAHKSYFLHASKKKEKNLIIVFDIPEKQKSKRDWLRAELLGLGFVMLQKSVWFGPAPISKEFIEILGDLGVLPYLKFFDAKESDII